MSKWGNIGVVGTEVSGQATEQAATETTGNIFTATANNTLSSSTISSLISGTELEQVSNEILSSAPVTQPIKTAEMTGLPTSLPKVNLDAFKQDNGLKVFGLNSSNAETIKQIATNKAGLDVNLSQNALSAIETLRTHAANQQAIDMAARMNGKIYVPAEAPSFDNKSLFALANAAQFNEIGNLDKDRKGSNPFVGTNTRKDSKEGKKDLNLVI